MAVSKDDVARIEGHLKSLGWPVISLAPNIWRSSFRGRSAAFPLVIQVEDGWCKLRVLPIVRLPADDSGLTWSGDAPAGERLLAMPLTS